MGIGIGIGLRLLFVDMAGKRECLRPCCSEGGLWNCVLTGCLTHFPALLFTGSTAITTVKKSSQSSKDNTRKTQQICVEKEGGKEKTKRGDKEEGRRAKWGVGDRKLERTEGES